MSPATRRRGHVGSFLLAMLLDACATSAGLCPAPPRLDTNDPMTAWKVRLLRPDQRSCDGQLLINATAAACQTRPRQEHWRPKNVLQLYPYGPRRQLVWLQTHRSRTQARGVLALVKRKGAKHHVEAMALLRTGRYDLKIRHQRVDQTNMFIVESRTCRAPYCASMVQVLRRTKDQLVHMHIEDDQGECIGDGQLHDHETTGRKGPGNTTRRSVVVDEKGLWMLETRHQRHRGGSLEQRVARRLERVGNTWRAQPSATQQARHAP